MESYDDGVAGNKRGSRRQKFITLMDLLASMPKHSLKGGGLTPGRVKFPTPTSGISARLSPFTSGLHFNDKPPIDKMDFYQKLGEYGIYNVFRWVFLNCLQGDVPPVGWSGHDN